MNKILVPIVAVALLAAKSHAAQIQGVTINAVSTQYANLSASTPDRRPSTNLVNSTGLFGDYLGVVPGGEEWLTSSNMFYGPTTNQAEFVTFDLGAVHTVNAIKVWNFNQTGAANLANDAKQAFISYSTDGVNFTTNYPGGQNFIQAPGAFSELAQTIATNMGFSARYVRLDISSNYTATGLTGTVGLGKVRFIDNSVPPTILAATENFGSNQITVQFSEPVDSASALNIANYSITCSGSAPGILSVTNGEFNDRVILSTTPLTNSAYSVMSSGVYDSALTTPTASATASVQPELIVWLKADTGVSTDGSGGVTNWMDQSSYGHNAGTNVVVNQYFQPPTLVAGAINGLPTLSFASGQLLSIPNDANLAINGDVTICVVLDKTTAAAGDVISKTGGQGAPYTGTPAHGYTNNMPGPFDYQINSTQHSTWTWGNGGGSSTGIAGATSSGAFAMNQYYIVTAVVQGTNNEWFLNGALNGTANLQNAPADAGNPMMLGVRLDSGNVGDAGLTFAGNIAEVMVIRGTVTPADLVNINGYLGAKYNIPVQGLAITEQPQNVTAQAGQRATFWANAVGIPPLTYQWRTNSPGGITNNIVGATNAVYTTPLLTFNPYNGLNYSVTVKTPVGTTNSAPATLTVLSDTTPPTVYSAVKAGGLTSVVVTFSEPVDASSALNSANYSLNNGGSILSASYGGVASNSVILATSALSPTTGYNVSVQNVQDLSGNVMTNTTMPVLPAGLSIYLRGDSGVVLDNSGNVDQWIDQTANGNNAVQYLGGSSARPSPSSINSTPSLNFNGNSSNYLQAASSSSLAMSGDISVYVVANFADMNAPRELVSKALGNIAASFDYYAWGARNYSAFLRGNGSTFGMVEGTVPTVGVAHVLSATMTGTNVNLFQDGVTNASGAITNNISDAGTPLFIGARADLNANWMNGQIGEVMIFNNGLSGADRTNVDNYLGQKYFQFTITSDLPPTFTTNEGTTVTYSFSASMGSAHLAYQWQENGTNIPGATGPSYTTPVLAPTDNGDTFDVVVTLPSGATAMSSTSTLTINNVPPSVTSAGIPIWSTTNIVVLFSEAVDPTTATSAGNYQLSGGATILAASMGDMPNKVVLTTSSLIRGNSYSITVQNIQDLYGNTIVAASPSVGIYPPATALWVRADTGITTDGGGVYQWNDLSGNGNNLMQPSGPPFEPQLVTNSLNGLPVVRFAATNETYMFAYSSPGLAVSGDMSIFAVMNFATLAGNTNGMIVSKTTGNIPAPYDYYVRPGQVQFYRGNGTVDGLVNSTNVPSTGMTHLLDAVMQGTAVNQRLDGNGIGSGTLSTTIGDNGDSLYIGTREDGADRLTGDMSELIVIGSAVDSNDVASLENYLATQYNLPTGLNSYPVISRQPVASTNVYQNTTLTVPTRVSGNPLTLQWYDTNGVAVVGQTNATLVVTNIQTSDAYYLVATNIYGSAISSGVDVTVIPVNVNPTNLVFSVANNQLTLSWPADHTGWQLQAQTNSLAIGINTNWVNMSGSTLTNQIVVPINLTNGTVFYRLMFQY